MAFITPKAPIRSIRGRLGQLHFRRLHANVGVEAPDPPPENNYPPFGRGQPAICTTQTGARRPPNAAQQQAAREARATAAAWSALSEAERATWTDVAAQLQLTDDPASIGELSGWAMFSASRRRFLRAGQVGPDEASFFGNPRIDRPWLKGWAGPTSGEIHLFADPETQPFPFDPAVSLVYASPPRPATRSAIARTQRFRGWIDPFDASSPGSPHTFAVEPWPTTGPGSVIDIKTSTADATGQSSNVMLTQLRTPPEGFALAFIAWTHFPFALGEGIELTADRILRVWSIDFPDGSPAELDLLNPTPKTIGQVRSFMAARTGWDVHTLTTAYNSAPAADLPAMPRRSHGFKQGALPIFARTT